MTEPDNNNLMDEQLEEIKRLKKINAVLLQRLEASTSYSNDAFSLFQHAVSLESKVKERTEELQRTLLQLERRSHDLESAKEQAEAASRAKSEFLATVSHEIRTPMNGVLGMTEIILNSNLNQKQQQQATTVYRSAKALLGVINKILDFSKIEAGKLELIDEDFNPRRLLEDICDMFAEQVERKQLKLLCKISDNIPVHVCGDSTRLRQIIVNLIGNAIKFTNEGHIALSVESEPGNDGALNLKFRVEDTGPGIPLEKQSDIFKAFTQADSTSSRQYDGTGLGLAITHKLVSLMDGKIHLCNQADCGCCFCFNVQMKPALHDEQTDMQTGATSSTENIAGSFNIDGREIHILLAEDNPINQEVAIGMLEDLNCEVTVADNGLQAIDAFGKRKYDLVLMDCHMPVLDGFDAADSIRNLEDKQTQARTPIIALTADVQEGIEEKCQQAGMDSYLSKPFSSKKLINTLSNWIGDTDDGSRDKDEDQAPLNMSVIDHTPLERLEALGNRRGKDTLGRVLSLFIKDADNQLEQLNDSINRMDHHAVTEAAHSLKSSSATVGAMSLSETCAQIETAGKNDDAEALPVLLDTVRHEIIAAKAELSDIMLQRQA